MFDWERLQHFQLAEPWRCNNIFIGAQIPVHQPCGGGLGYSSQTTSLVENILKLVLNKYICMLERMQTSDMSCLGME